MPRVEIDEPRHRRVKARAAEQGLTIIEYIAQLIDKALPAPEKRKRKRGAS